jgi:hypothetical protein
MGTLVGILLVVIAAATIVGVLWMVMREPHTHEEYYIPPARTNAEEAPGAPSTTGPASVRDMVAETAGSEIPPSPEAERAAHDHQDTTA